MNKINKKIFIKLIKNFNKMLKIYLEKMIKNH